MPHEKRYFIEYRICGKLRLELLDLEKELANQFPDLEQYGEQILHVTLIPPINQNIQKEFILESVREELKKFRILEFKIKNYDFFDNEYKKVIFVNVGFRKDFLGIRNKLIKRLERKVGTIDEYANEGFNPHIALGFVSTTKKAREIVKFLNKTHTLEMEQILDRITVLNGNRILWEYDIFNHRVLSRSEALQHRTRLDNIKNIIEIKNKVK